MIDPLIIADLTGEFLAAALFFGLFIAWAYVLVPFALAVLQSVRDRLVARNRNK